MNADEAAEGAIFVSGFSAPDLQSVAATVTDGSGGLTVTASLGDISNNIPPSVAATVVGYEGDLTVRFSSDPSPEAVGALDVTLVAQPMNPSVGGLTHAVDFTDAFNLANAADMATLFATGQFFAQAFDAEGSSLMSSLIDQSNISVSVAATDTAGNTDAVAPSDVAFLDTTADVEGDLSVSVDSVINDAESGTVQITISGVDADVASPGGVVVSVGDSNADEIATAQKTKDDAEADLASLKAQLAPLVAIVGLEQLGLSELNSALGAAETRVSARQGDKDNAEADYNTAYAEARAAFVMGQRTLTHCPTGDPVVAPIVSPSVSIDWRGC